MGNWAHIPLLYYMEMAMLESIRRSIEVFHRDADELVIKVFIDVTPDTLKQVYGENPEDPEYVVDRELLSHHAEKLKEFTDLQFDFERYVYFYSAHT